MTLPTQYRTHLIALVLGVLSFSAAWGAWHLWQDHRVFHELLNLEIQRQQAIQQMRQQQAPPTPLPAPVTAPKSPAKGGG